MFELFVASIPVLIKAGGAVADYVHKAREAAKQSGEWNDIAQAVYDQALAEANNAPESRTDAEA